MESKILQNLLTQLPRRFWRLLTGAGSGLLALLILFEEWGWVPLQRVLAHIGRWPGLRWVEGWVRTLPPWGAVAVFVLPTTCCCPSNWWHCGPWEKDMWQWAWW